MAFGLLDVSKTRDPISCRLPLFAVFLMECMIECAMDCGFPLNPTHQGHRDEPLPHGSWVQFSRLRQPLLPRESSPVSASQLPQLAQACAEVPARADKRGRKGHTARCMPSRLEHCLELRWTNCGWSNWSQSQVFVGSPDASPVLQIPRW